MAYRADIEIGVKGARQLEDFKARLAKLSRQIDNINKQPVYGTKQVTSVNEYNKALKKAEATLNKTRLQLDKAGNATASYKIAIETYVTALGRANQRQAIQNDLIEQEISRRNAATNAIRAQVAANVALSRASRAESGFGAFSASLKPTPIEKAIRRNREKTALARAAAETAVQVSKLNQRQEEFITRTNAAAQAAARQTAEFYRQARIAREVAKINAAAGPTQLLLAPARPGAPAMGGGARRRITGSVERLGGARTADEAAATLRLAQATDALSSSTKKIDPKYSRFLPDTKTLDATNRGIQRLITNQEEFDQAVRRGIRFNKRYNQELERRQRLGISGPASNRMPGVTGVTGGPFPVDGPIAPSRPTTTRTALPLGRALSSGVIGGAFPLLFGQGGGAATGGAIGGFLGGLAGPGAGFAGSLLGTLIGDIATKGQKIKELAQDIGFSTEQTKMLSQAFKKAGTDIEDFTSVIQNIRGVGLEIEDQAKAIKLVTALTDKYGGAFDKVGNAITSALEQGRVSQGTLNQLTSQGVDVQGALADKYKVSRDAILQMAKDGDISVQDLINTLVDMGNKGVESANKPKSAMDKFKDSVVNLGTKIAEVANGIITALTPVFNWLLKNIANILNGVARAISRFQDLTNGGRMAQADIRAGEAAKKATIDKYGAGWAFNPEAEKYFKKQKQAALKGLVPGAYAPEKPQKVESFAVPTQLQPSSGKAANKANREANREAERVAKLVVNQQAITRQLQIQSAFSAQIAAAELAGDSLLVRRLQGEQQLAELGIQTARSLELESNTAAQLAIARSAQAKADLIRQNTAEDTAKIEADNLKTATDLLAQIDYELELNSALTREAQTEVSIKKELDDLRKKGIVDEQTLLAIAERRRQLAEPTQLRDFIRTASDELNNLQITAVNVSNAIGNAIGNSMAQGIERLVEGTQTAQEVFANFLKAVGQALVQEGTKMISTYIAIGIARIFAGFSSPKVDSKGATAIGAAAGGGGGSAFNIGAAAGGLANGGAVRSSTPYLVGERGPELFVPGMNGGVMSNSDLRSAMGAAPGSASGSPTLNMSFETTNIAGVEYVSREQLEAAMVATRRQATRDGAKRGMSMTLDRIQQSPQTRNRLGIG